MHIINATYTNERFEYVLTCVSKTFCSLIPNWWNRAALSPEQECITLKNPNVYYFSEHQHLFSTVKTILVVNLGLLLMFKDIFKTSIGIKYIIRSTVRAEIAIQLFYFNK